MSSSSSIAERPIEIPDAEPELQLIVLVGNETAWQGRLPTRLEIGRQNTTKRLPDPGPYQLLEDGEFARLIVASKSERKVSRNHVRITLAEGKLTVENRSKIQPIRCNHNIVPPREQRSFDWLSIVRIELHQRTLVVSPGADSASLRSLNTQTRSPGANLLPNKFASEQVDLSQLNHAPEFTMWLSETIEVLQSAVNSPDFLRLACQAAVDIVKLDHAQILLREGAAWNREAWHARVTSGMREPPTPSAQVMQQILRERKTYWMLPMENQADSLTGISTVIASPILDSEGAVIGALYGDQRANTGMEIRELEAKMVEVLAYAVASGLSTRKHQEQAMLAKIQAAEERARLEQFFSPKLAAALLEQPELLHGRDMEVSVLFCDLREFTRVSDNIPSRKVLQWLNAVQDMLSECVIDHNGVLVDYVGDAMLAMWGAPIHQPEHATLACRAAIDMKRQLPKLDAAWKDTLGHKTRVGIGISTGMALVGNTGSKKKFKYGPLGRTVNIGSRVQDATRTLNTPIIAIESTIQRLTETFSTRKIGCVRLHNLQTPETIYELNAAPTEAWTELREGYESALQAFEDGDYGDVCEKVEQLLTRWPQDGPTLCLRRRAQAGVADGEAFDQDWSLGKCDL